MNAQAMRRKLRFEAREIVSDGYGNEYADWIDHFIRRAEIRPLRGGEAVMAARLAGVQPVIIRVRRDSDTVAIAPEWRAVDVFSGEVYALKAVADMEQRNRDLTITAEAGVTA